jgi:hypothetical protein
VTITTIRVTDKLRAACLRVAMYNKQAIDVVNEDGDTVRGMVLALHQDKGEASWVVVLEVA